MTDAQWFWWASADKESYIFGPYDTREEAIQTGINDELGVDEIDGRLVANFHIVEAQQAPLKIKDWIATNEMFDRADEEFYDSEFCGEDQDGPFFDATAEQCKDLIERIGKVCDEWQAAHGLVFKPWAFTAQRNADVITHDLGPVEGMP